MTAQNQIEKLLEFARQLYSSGVPAEEGVQQLEKYAREQGLLSTKTHDPDAPKAVK